MRTITIVMLLAFALISGCSSAESKAKELYETALFEEKQNNFEHATKLYDEIIRTYPNTRVAADAALRQNVLKSSKH